MQTNLPETLRKFKTTVIDPLLKVSAELISPVANNEITLLERFETVLIQHFSYVSC